MVKGGSYRSIVDAAREEREALEVVSSRKGALKSPGEPSVDPPLGGYASCKYQLPAT